MKLTKREHLLLRLLLLVLIWGLAFRFIFAPSYGSLIYTRQVLEEVKQEKAEKDLYLECYPDLEAQWREGESREGQESFFYQDIEDVFIDRKLQAIAEKAGIQIRRMSIEEPGLMERPEEEAEHLKELPLMERKVTMEVEGQDERGMMEFADGVYQEGRSLVISYMDIKRESGTATVSQAGQAGMKGIVEVRFYYEKTK